jgi:hypothetical protein
MSRFVWISLVALAAAACSSEPVQPPPPPPQPAPTIVLEEPAPAPEPSPPPEPEKPARPEQGSGPYRVAIASEKTSAAATRWVRKLEAEDFRVETESVDLNGTTWLRVVLPGYRNGREAREAVAYLDSQLGIKAWVVPKGAPGTKVPSAPAASSESAPAAPAAKPAPSKEPAPQPGLKPEDPEHPEN